MADDKENRFGMFVPFSNRRALVRTRQGVYKITTVVSRGGNEYIQWNSGFLRICAKVGDTWPTSMSGVTVVEIGDI